jgi:signal transduction histidine kinase
MKIRSKLLLAFLLLSFVPLSAVTVAIYRSYKANRIEQIHSHMESVASVQQSRLEAILAQNLERLRLVASRTQLRLSLAEFNLSKEARHQRKMNQILNDAWNSINELRSLSIADPQGNTVASTAPLSAPSIVTDSAWFQAGLAGERVDIFSLDETAGLQVILTGPLVLEKKMIGVLKIEASVDNFLASVRDYTGLGESGETVLATLDPDGSALFLMPTRFNRDAALRLRVSKEQSDPMFAPFGKDAGTLSDTLDYRGQPVIAAARQLHPTGWSLVVKIDSREALTPLVKMRNRLLVIASVSALAAAIAAWFLANGITRPIVRLTAVAERQVTEGGRLLAEEGSADETGVLANAFNAMTAKLIADREQLEERVKERTSDLQKAYEQLLHAEKLTAVGSLSASIAHEFNNPLQGVINVLKGITRRVTMDRDNSELVQIALGECHRMRDLIRQLQDFNRPTSGRKGMVDLHGVLDGLLLLGKHDLDKRSITIRKCYCEGLPPFIGVTDQLKQVFLNLLNNATQACAGGGIITLETGFDAEWITVHVSDTGEGITEENLKHIFEPFFTTRPEVKGTGLGLSVSHGIIKDHGGRIDVVSKEGHGARFSIILPRNDRDNEAKENTPG